MNTGRHSTGNIIAMNILRILVLAFVVVAAGCDGDGVIRPPPVRVKVYNAAANIESILFLRERAPLGETTLSYNNGLETSFDSGQYDFNVEYRPLGSNSNVAADSVSETLSPDQSYTFVVVAPTGVPELFSVATDNLATGFSDTRVSVIHAFPGLGDLDVYLDPPGTDLTTATPRGTLSYGPNAVTAEFAPNPYRVFLTTAGDPTDILFESASQAASAGEDRVLAVSDPGSGGTLSILVAEVSGVTRRIGGIGEQSLLRVIQGVDDRLARDIYLDDTTSAPLFPAQPFGELSAYADIEIGQHDIVTTPLNNPGTEDTRLSYFAVPGQLFTAVIAGDTVDGISMHIVNEDKRSIASQATARVVNAAGQFTVLSIYIEEPGTDVTTLSPRTQMFPPASSSRIPLLPGDYEITIEDPVTATIVAGPLAVTLDDGGVYGILLINGPDASTVDIELFDDFAP
jgi:hypothetical protein